MSEWDFLWDLEGQELEDAMSSGMTESDMEYIENNERNREWTKLKMLRDSKQISKEEFKQRKQELSADTLDD